MAEAPIIWHNPRCAKSRRGLAILEEHGLEPTIVRYLVEPPDAETLDRVLEMLNLSPRELMRKREAPYKELGLADPAKSREELIEAMVAHPKLIERPVVIYRGKAALGRPPERIEEIL